MPYVNLPTTKPVYDAAERFVDAALRSDDSIFTPGQPIWSLPVIEDLYQRIVIRLDKSNDNFLEKLRKQLADADPATYQLAAEVLYVQLLIATGTIGSTAKHRLVNTILSWSPKQITIPSKRDAALDQGIARVGTAYLTYRPFQVGFLLTFVRAWKQLPQVERERALNDPWAFKDALFDLPISKAYAQREALLHLVHPGTFEGIVSREHKRVFAQKYAQYITTPIDDVDRKLAQIRANYLQQHGVEIDFYDVGGPQQPPSGPLPRSLGNNLKTYIQLAIHLNDAAYTPEEVVERLGRVSPPIITSATAPDADELVRDLVHLRLLETLDDGSYRRWPHLADVNENHMLRYAASTLLVSGNDGYILPLSKAPFDDQPHSTADLPYGEALLAWYEQAGLVQRNQDGTWQSLPHALEPIPADTATARALNTFLDHLKQVQASRRDLPPLADDALPILDPTTLEERIAEIQRELLIDRSTILRIYRALIAGQHVILSGPPGTGKTHLARLLPQILWRDPEPTVILDMPLDPRRSPTEPPSEQHLYREGYDVDVATATEDWGVRHVIGGIVPQVQRNGEVRTLVYSMRHGYLTRSVLANYSDYDGNHVPALESLRRQEIVGATGQRFRGRWLVIDEFTRAPIDAAFGSLLTTLGGQRSPLTVPTDDGEMAVPLPRDFRMLGTLNSFDRHFLNQISEAMKRRFTFIDVLPPSRDLAGVEEAITVYRALLRLSEQGLIEPQSVDAARGWAALEDVLHVSRPEATGDERATPHYQLIIEDVEAADALTSFWRIFRAIRVYRQLGTAQAEAVCSALFTGQSVGMEWNEALDSALADTLADQLQVLTRDEQRVLLAFIEYASAPVTFTTQIQRALAQLPGPRQGAHLALLRAANPQAGESLIDNQDSSKLTADQLGRVFELGSPLVVSADGLFARRLRAFVNERGL